MQVSNNNYYSPNFQAYIVRGNNGEMIKYLNSLELKASKALQANMEHAYENLGSEVENKSKFVDIISYIAGGNLCHNLIRKIAKLTEKGNEVVMVTSAKTYSDLSKALEDALNAEKELAEEYSTKVEQSTLLSKLGFVPNDKPAR